MYADESLIDVEKLAWHQLVEGVEVKLLFSSSETGRWTVLLKCQPGSSFGKHKHYGAGEYFVVKGHMEYRMGGAKTGDFGYEPLGAVHELTSFTEYTELLFTNYGPVLFLDDEDNVISILDNSSLEELTQAS